MPDHMVFFKFHLGLLLFLSYASFELDKQHVKVPAMNYWPYVKAFVSANEIDKPNLYVVDIIQNWKFYMETAKQPLRAIVDTSIEDIFLYSNSCHVPANTSIGGDGVFRVLDPRNFHSGSNFSFQLGYVNLTLNKASDLILIRQKSLKTEINNFTFCQIVSISNISLVDSMYKMGIFGLSSNVNSSVSKLRTASNRILTQLAHSAFFFDCSDGPCEVRFRESSITDWNNKDVIVPVTSKTFWNFNFVMIISEKLSICEKYCSAIFDSSTHLILGPREDVERINKFLNASRVNGTGLQWKMQCPTIKNKGSDRIIIQISESVFIMDRQSLTIRDPHDEDLCYSVVMELATPRKNSFGESYDWIFGFSFLQKFLVYFDVRVPALIFNKYVDVSKTFQRSNLKPLDKMIV